MPHPPAAGTGRAPAHPSSSWHSAVGCFVRPRKHTLPPDSRPEMPAHRHPSGATLRPGLMGAGVATPPGRTPCAGRFQGASPPTRPHSGHGPPHVLGPLQQMSTKGPLPRAEMYSLPVRSGRTGRASLPLKALGEAPPAPSRFWAFPGLLGSQRRLSSLPLRSHGLPPVCPPVSDLPLPSPVRTPAVG